MVSSYEITRGHERNIYITVNCTGNHKENCHYGSGGVVPVYRVTKPPFKCEEPVVIIDGIRWPRFVLNDNYRKIDDEDHDIGQLDEQSKV